MSDHENQEAPKTELQVLKDRARLMGLTFSNNISVDKLREKINAKLTGEADTSDANASDDGVDGDDDSGDTQEQLFAAPLPTPAALQTSTEVAADEPAPVKIADLMAAAVGKTPQVIGVAGAAPVEAAPIAAPARKLNKVQLAQHIRAELQRTEMKLLRVRITNMDPKKKDLPGEIFSVGNKYLGTIKKYVPYGEATDEGYHLPKIIVDQLMARQFQDIRIKKDRRTGTNEVVSRWVREFAIEILPPLTPEELTNLAIAQAAAGSIE